MKVFLKEVFKIDDGYQETIIDENNFGSVNYNHIFPIEQNIGGLTFNDVYVIEPDGYYEIILQNNTPSSRNFYPARRLLEAGLIVSNINKKSVFIYNPTKNHIYIRSKAVIGEVE